jgi:CHASE1-domain containing sensor protein
MSVVHFLRRQDFWLSLRRNWAAWLVGLVGCLIMLFACHLSVSEQRRTLRETATEVTESVTSRLPGQFHALEQSLLAAAALFEDKPFLHAGEWERFVARMDLAHHYPGFAMIGFAQLLSRDGASAHEAEMRRLGRSGYSVHPPTQWTSPSAVSHVYPLAERNRQVLGFDLLADSDWREAVLQARDTGTMVISSKLNLRADALVQPALLAFHGTKKGYVSRSRICCRLYAADAGQRAELQSGHRPGDL